MDIRSRSERRQSMRTASGISTSAGESTDVSSRATGKSGQVDRPDPPAVMLEHALERR